MAEPKSPTAPGQPPSARAGATAKRDAPDAEGRAGELPAVGEIRIEEGVEADLEWPDGLVAVGGELSPEMLIRAYRNGVFPWSSDPAVTWWSPDPRAIFDLEGFRANRSLRKSIRRGGWTFTTDRDFAAVMRACAEPTPDRPSTWISAEFMAAYSELNRRGLAHSLEVWEGSPAHRAAGDTGSELSELGELIGGLYGVTLGGFFGGESMFRRRTDASKAAVAFLVEHLRARGFALLDAQVPTAHLESLGATRISRADYLARLRRALALPVSF
jgi:leucyl/phenylalanyl-tRNA---protein transferase